MIWIICAVLAVILIVLSVVSGLLKKKDGSLRMVAVLACLFAATFVIYIPIFFSSYDFLLALAGNLVNLIRIVTTDIGVTEFYETIAMETESVLLTRIYAGIAGLLHLVLPAVSALTAVKVLFGCFAYMRLALANRGKKPMYVFSEINERSVQLAKNLKKQKCNVVFAGSAEDTIMDGSDNRWGFIYKEEPISEIQIRSIKGKDIHFFCISEDEDASLSYCLQLIERFVGESEEDQSHIHIYQFSRHEDFSVYIDAADKGALDVRCFNEYELLVYDLLDKYPLMQYAKDKIHILLYGLSEINVIALRAVCWCSQLSGYSVKISAVGMGIAQKAEELKARFPGLFTHRYDIRIYDCAGEGEVADTISRECPDANYIIVCDDSDNATMEQGIMLRRLFYRLDPAFSNCPPIFCYIKEPSKFNILKNLTTAETNPKQKMNYQLTPFGSLQEIYTYEKLVDSDLEALAKNVHLAYEEIFSDGEIDVKEALKRYNVFEVNKRSNRANALHIRYKLRMLGLDYTANPQAQEVAPEAYYTEAAIDRMARCEHDRWMAFLETEGWLPAEKEQVEAYRASDISKGRHNCPVLKMHPYICEYEKLKALSMDLEGKDTTVYDRELILRIPDILGDKWGATGKRYKIIGRQ